MSLTHDANLQSGEYVKIASDLERLGDHAPNIMERLLLIHDSKHDLSAEAREELATMSRLALEILDQLKGNCGRQPGRSQQPGTINRPSLRDLRTHANSTA